MRDEQVFVVIPAYNEGALIGRVVGEVRERYPRVVVVDDGSRDETALRAQEAGAVVLRHPLNRGQGAALMTGIEYARRQGASCVVTFDADGQHSAEDIPTLVEPIARGEAAIVLGSRFLGQAPQMPASRRLLLRGAIAFTRVFSGLALSDAHNGLRAFSREAAERIDLRLDRMAHASEVLDQIGRLGLPYREVPVTIRYTEYSLAKGQRGLDALKVAFDYLVGRLFA